MAAEIKRGNDPIRILIQIGVFKFLHNDYGMRNMLLIILKTHQMSWFKRTVGDEESSYGTVLAQGVFFTPSTSFFCLSFLALTQNCHPFN